MTEQRKETGTPVVVTTEHRGVFFGFRAEGSGYAETVELAQAQMCVSWSASIGGVLGLAATGPDSKCRVSPPVPTVALPKVTAIMEATPEAVTAWQAKPWSRS